MPLHPAAGLPGAHSPLTQGLVAWSYDPVLTAATLTATAGTVYMVKLVNYTEATVTKLYWHVAAVAVTPTAGQSEVGLYSSAGSKLVAVNVDADILSTGVKTTTIAAQALTPGSFVWAALVFNAATPPGIGRTTAVTGSASLSNVGLTAALTRCGTGGTSQTSLPLSITPGSISQSTSAVWAAIGT